MAAELGPEYRVVEEAQNGRTTVLDDPYELVCKNGKKALPTALESHAPIDLVVIMLGTNDLKHYFDRAPQDVAERVATLAKIVQSSTAGLNHEAPEVLLVSPPKIADAPCPFGPKLDGAAEKSPLLPAEYSRIANELGVPFFDAATVAQCPETDCIHIDETGHQALGLALAQQVSSLLS